MYIARKWNHTDYELQFVTGDDKWRRVSNYAHRPALEEPSAECNMINDVCAQLVAAEPEK